MHSIWNFIPTLACIVDDNVAVDVSRSQSAAIFCCLDGSQVLRLVFPILALMDFAAAAKFGAQDVSQEVFG